MQDTLKNFIKTALKNLGIEVGEISLEHPADLSMGDYSTNVAMILAKSANTNPKELAEKIVEILRQAQNKFPEIQEIQAKNGFINFYLSKEFFQDSIQEVITKDNFGQNENFLGKKIMVEYTDPNPFKPFHIGHLMTNTIGESIARILEFSGAKLIRANYQGDVGPHVAKAIYILRQNELPVNMAVSEAAKYIGECYAKGNDVYEEDEEGKREIDEINKKIYEKSDPEINRIYDWGRMVTLEAFEEIYRILGTSFNYYFFESAMAPIGEKIVKNHLGGIFEESDGAIVFHAEKFDPKLHTRVFINSQGLPTYEAKELGLVETKFQKENPDISIVITAEEQKEYMKVVLKSLEQIEESYAKRTKHITHGMMKLSTGKMSSRKGNVITGESLLRDSCEQILERIKDRDFTDEEKKKVSEEVGVAALKYSILKQNIGGDIIYDREKSISLEGDSGPYLQYSYARAKSVLEKAKKENILPGLKNDSSQIELIEKLLFRFKEVSKRSAIEFSPHYVTNYLVDLARTFNAYYANTKIIDKDDPASSYRIAITLAFSNVMKNGLYLLGIKVPERM